MKISKVGLDLIKSFEGCSLKAYKCPAGVWTIGYGHTGGVKPGQTITHAQAVVMLQTDLGSYEMTVNKNVKVPINQNQFDALVSFTYNCGCNALRTSVLLKLLNKGDYTGAANQFDLWVNGGGKRLSGLVRRRAAEKELFLEPVKNIQDKELSSAISKIIRSGIEIDFNKWKRLDLINLKNVPSLLDKLGGLEKLIADKVISDKQLWLTGRYNANAVRSLLIKYSNML